MKKILFATAAAAITLSGCASVSTSPTHEVDTLYVARVEQAARQMGTTVVWINYPTRAVAAAQEATKK